MNQLELFHHIASGGLDLGNTDRPHFTEMVVVETALSTPYLMNELLAFAACHFSFLRPNKSSFYRHQAMQLQTHALSLFNKTPTEIGPHNYMGVVGFSWLLSAHILRDTTIGPEDDFLNRFLRYLEVYRGVRMLTSQAWQYLLESKMSNVIAAGINLSGLGSSGAETAKLRETIQASRTLSAEEVKYCQEAIDKIQWSIDALSSSHDDRQISHSFQMVFAWPLLIDVKVVDLLLSRNPEALLVLAFYGVVLHLYRGAWLFRNIGTQVVESIVSYLGPAHQHITCLASDMVHANPD
ncbi:hypothetical protein JX265_000074 [Neoarthrinium moseri]|uniref:C6 transcription factor n=1 Tax=Neoarthrinium moseri TaxID=1658444 RepID=A0A9Q0ARX4_9PEZI|nr:hypothetical protein JX266_008112 [Neoarthrinium moseri]KAI1881248.1 hypothetical protein JX265_000074 [Neoarthrinium moseri]